jgi:AcrR family transcriptional regulator
MHLPVTPKGRKTRVKILDTAWYVVAQHSLVGMRVGDVAIEAALSLGTFYRYFENKDDMFSHLIANFHKGFYAASCATQSDSRTDPYAVLRDANYGYLKHY